jgi:hypothetical protein
MQTNEPKILVTETQKFEIENIARINKIFNELFNKPLEIDHAKNR